MTESRRNTTVAMVAVASAVAVALLVIGGIALLVAGHDNNTDQPPALVSSSPLPLLPPKRPAPPPNSGALPAFAPNPPAAANCQYPPAAGSAGKKVNPPPSGEVSTTPATIAATMATDQGAIGLMLDNAKAPCTVNSFVSLARQGYFDNTPCHRLTTSPSLSVLQCGDPTGIGTGGPGYQFADEYPADQYPPGDPNLRIPVAYPRGTLAMANAGPGTNGSQFFLVYGDSQLPPNYTVFGTIDAAGLATLDTIAAAGVTGGSADGAPQTPVTITSVQLS